MESQEQFMTNLEKYQEKLIHNQHWTPEQEKLLKMWAEKASGYRWMHSRAEKYFDITAIQILVVPVTPLVIHIGIISGFGH